MGGGGGGGSSCVFMAQRYPGDGATAISTEDSLGFRASKISAYLGSGGRIENAQAIAAHESPRMIKLYDRTGDEITLNEIERILI